jgi:glycosyltransferase involved in cell wall biosynthesis
MKITIVIPTYNGENTIKRAIESVLNQSSDIEKEILICDDCSTDDTVQIAKKLGCNVFVNDKNSGGPNKGRNIGIKNATGNLIAFLDQDDEWLPNKLEIQLKEIENGNDFVYSSYIKK